MGVPVSFGCFRVAGQSAGDINNRLYNLWAGNIPSEIPGAYRSFITERKKIRCKRMNAQNRRKKIDRDRVTCKKGRDQLWEQKKK